MRPRPAVLRMLLVVCTMACAASAGLSGGVFKSTPRLALEQREATGGSQRPIQQSQQWRRQKQQRLNLPPVIAFQGLKRRVLELNNGTLLALAGALAGGFSNREWSGRQGVVAPA